MKRTTKPAAPKAPAMLSADAVGHTAGAVWKVLAEQGTVSLAKVVTATGEPRDQVMMAVGWLAREGKVSFEGTPRAVAISLRPE